MAAHNLCNDADLERLCQSDSDAAASDFGDDVPTRPLKPLAMLGVAAIVGVVGFGGSRWLRSSDTTSPVHVSSLGASFGMSLTGNADDQKDEGKAYSKLNTRQHKHQLTHDGDPLTPAEDLNDGNYCDDTEEELGGLCYRKCSLFTGGKYPYRKTAFTCCKTKLCPLSDLMDMKSASFVPCRGYDMSSEDGGKACPHTEGYCLEDEETHLNECYKKCSILTNGTYPTRVAPLTCCKATGAACMWPFNDWTSGAFNTGGGDGYPHPHAPDTHLTEPKQVEAED